MSSEVWLLDDPNAAHVVSRVLALAAAFMASSRTTWKRRFEGRERVHEETDGPEKEFYLERGGTDLYGLVGDLQLDPGESTRRGARLAARVRVVAGLDPEARHKAVVSARGWADKVGTFAEKTCRENKVPLRTFLQTNHLALIRQGALAEPFLVWSWATEPVEEREQFERECSALALSSVARTYNSVARQQREQVFFDRQPPDYVNTGVVQDSPHWATRPLRNVQDVLSPWFRLRAHRLWLAKRRVTRAAKRAVAA